jgi:hypothetical protein
MLVSPEFRRRCIMSRSREQVRYLWTTALVWAAIWIGTAVVQKGSDGFADMIPILTVGTGWFIAVVPALDRR